MMLALFVLIPLLASAFLAVLLRSYASIVKYIALLASIVSFLLIAYLYLNNGAGGVQSFQWFALGGIAFNISVTTAATNMLLLLIVGIMTPLIFLYSIGFMNVPSEQSRFYFEMSVFAAAMMLFAISASFITMFIAWEMLGITSYLLIGFWYWKKSAPTAARKAITTILIGDILMLAAILLIGVAYNSFEFSAVLAAPPSAALDTALILILIAAFTKSAQFPFHEWLPDAMEGPTPVSAFLHSSTMVKAGVFLVAVLLPLYASANLLPVILAFGLISAILGATNALAERHIKKILAYSTIEDLGLMFVALGLGSLAAAMLLFFVQTFYKALLFMGAGSIMRANDEREDVFQDYASTANKLLFISIVIGAVSLAGIFPLSGAFGKDAVEAAGHNIVIYAVLLLISLVTSLYIFRWMFIPMGKSFKDESVLEVNYKTLPKTMQLATAILAIFVIAAAGAYLYLPAFLGVSQAPVPPYEFAVGTAIAVAGLLLAYRVYRQGHRFRIASTNRPVYVALYNSIIVNGAYLYLTKAIGAVSDGAGYIDLKFDKLTYSVSSWVIRVGEQLRLLVNGQTNFYVLGFIIGVVFLLLVFMLV